MKKADTQRKNPNQQQAGLYGSQAPKPSARPSSGDTVVQSKPGGQGPRGDKLSEPGYVEDKAERELGSHGKARSRRKSGMAPR